MLASSSHGRAGVELQRLISSGELQRLLELTYGMTPTREQLGRLMAAVDRSGDGFISLDEFIEGMATVPELQNAADVYKWHQQFNECAAFSFPAPTPRGV